MHWSSTPWPRPTPRPGATALAIETAEAALALVPADRAPELRAGIRSRLRLYAGRQPYRRPLDR